MIRDQAGPHTKGCKQVWNAEIQGEHKKQFPFMMRAVTLVALLQLASAFNAGYLATTSPRALVRDVGRPIVVMAAEDPAPEAEPMPSAPAADVEESVPPPAAEKMDYTQSGMASPVGLAAIAAIGLASYFGVFPN